MQQLEASLKALLKAGDEAALITFVKKTVLESYRNGQKASKPQARKRKS